MESNQSYDDIQSNIKAFPRKKKRSFLQKAKKFGKSGRFGKGKEIDRETYDYFLRVFEQLNHGFDSDDESKDVFVTNVFETTINEEVSLCSNQLVSRVLERLLPLAREEVRVRFMQCLADDLRIVAVDPFSSHVLETLLLLATFEKSKFETAEKKTEQISYRRNWVIRVSKFMINNFDEFSNNIYASHLLRTCFQCLGGTRLEDNITRSRKSRDQQPNQSNTSNELEVSSFKCNESQITSPLEQNSLFEPLLMAVNKTLTSNVLEMSSFDTSSAVIQALILVLSKTMHNKECKQLCEFLLENVFKGKNLAASKDDETTESPEEDEHFLQYESCGRLFETIIMAAENIPKVFKKCKKIIEKNIHDWAIHPIGNFALQKFLAICNEKEIIEKWYESVFDDNLEEILAAGNSGVVLSLARAICRLGVKQAHFLVSIMKSLHCYEPSQHQLKFVPLLAHLSTRESYEEASKNDANDNQLRVNLHGALIIQELFNFNKPIKVVNSFLDLDSNELKNLLCDPRGCHITDSFMQSKTIGEKSRDGLVKLLQNNLVAMACSKHGSRSVDKMWEKSSPKGREMIAQQLASQLSLLTNNSFGRFLAQNLFLSTFKRSKEEWRLHLQNQEKQKVLAKDFLSELSSNKRQTEDNQSVKNKKVKRDEGDQENSQGFVIDTMGHQNIPVPLDDSLQDAGIKIKSKKKKEKAKSYLDDL